MLIDLIIATFLGGLLICVILVTRLLYKYVAIFNSIYQNTEEIKRRVQALDRNLAPQERDAFARAFEEDCDLD